MNELDRYAVSLENMEVLRAQVEEQARELERLKQGQDILILARDEQKRLANEYRDLWSRAALSANHSEQVRDLPPFAQKVISKLKRFEEYADDGQGADIGRHWFDLLTQLGLLNRVQRSPGLWEITVQGEDVLAAAPSAGSQGGDV